MLEWAKKEWDDYFYSDQLDALAQRFKHTHVVTFPFIDLIGSGVASPKGGKVPVRFKIKSPTDNTMRVAERSALAAEVEAPRQQPRRGGA